MNLTGAEIAALHAGATIKLAFPGNCTHVFGKDTKVNLEA